MGVPMEISRRREPSGGGPRSWGRRRSGNRPPSFRSRFPWARSVFVKWLSTELNNVEKEGFAEEDVTVEGIRKKWQETKMEERVKFSPDDVRRIGGGKLQDLYVFSPDEKLLIDSLEKEGKRREKEESPKMEKEKEHGKDGVKEEEKMQDEEDKKQKMQGEEDKKIKDEQARQLEDYIDFVEKNWVAASALVKGSGRNTVEQLNNMWRKANMVEGGDG